MFASILRFFFFFFCAHVTRIFFFFFFFLTQSGARINDANIAGDTPLHICSTERCGELISYLIEHEADKSVKNKEGKTPEDMLN
jgi:ankyrin repeat protein